MYTIVYYCIVYYFTFTVTVPTFSNILNHFLMVTVIHGVSPVFTCDSVAFFRYQAICNYYTFPPPRWRPSWGAGSRHRSRRIWRCFSTQSGNQSLILDIFQCICMYQYHYSRIYFATHQNLIDVCHYLSVSSILEHISKSCYLSVSWWNTKWCGFQLPCGVVANCVRHCKGRLDRPQLLWPNIKKAALKSRLAIFVVEWRLQAKLLTVFGYSSFRRYILALEQPCMETPGVHLQILRSNSFMKASRRCPFWMTVPLSSWSWLWPSESYVCWGHMVMEQRLARQKTALVDLLSRSKVGSLEDWEDWIVLPMLVELLVI